MTAIITIDKAIINTAPTTTPAMSPVVIVDFPLHAIGFAVSCGGTGVNVRVGVGIVLNIVDETYCIVSTTVGAGAMI